MALSAPVKRHPITAWLERDHHGTWRHQFANHQGAWSGEHPNDIAGALSSLVEFLEAEGVGKFTITNTTTGEEIS